MSRGARKRSIHDISRDAPTEEDRQASYELLDNAPDLVVAILYVAIIEYEIEKLIFRRLKRADPETIEKLTRNDGPLTTLSSKASLAYAMGAFDLTILRAITTLRVIRNAFAHARKPIKFDAEEIVAELNRVSLPNNKRTKLYERLNAVRSSKADPRLRFRLLGALISSWLSVRHSKMSIKASNARTRKLEKQIEKIQIGVLGLSATPRISLSEISVPPSRPKRRE